MYTCFIIMFGLIFFTFCLRKGFLIMRIVLKWCLLTAQLGRPEMTVCDLDLSPANHRMSESNYWLTSTLCTFRTNSEFILSTLLKLWYRASSAFLLLTAFINRQTSVPTGHSHDLVHLIATRLLSHHCPLYFQQKEMGSLFPNVIVMLTAHRLLGHSLNFTHKNN